MCKNELNQHKKSDKIKWIATLMAGVMLTAGVATSLTLGAKNNGWFENDVEQIQPDEKDEVLDETVEEVGAPIISEDENYGIQLMAASLDDEDGIAAVADNSQTITAVVTPAEATNKTMEWSVEWKNASSTWATGKTVTSYVTVTPTSTGAMTATVTCKAAFSEPVIVKAAIKDDSGIYGTCQVDYARKVTGTNLTLNIGASYTNVGTGEWVLQTSNTAPTVAFPSLTSTVLNDAQGWVFGACNYDGGGTKLHAREDEVTITTVKGDTYTVDNLSSLTTKAYVLGSTAYFSALSTAGFSPSGSANTYYELNYKNTSGSVNGTHISFGDVLYGKFMTAGGTTASNPTLSKWNNFRNALASNASTATINLKFETLQGSTVVATTVYTIRFTTASLAVRAESVSFSSGITF
jgi:hypothetical protein